LKILKPFGIDLPARMAEVWVDLEERFDLAKDSVEQTIQTAALLGTLFFLAGVAALSAFGVGLVALYTWVSSNYGQFMGLPQSPPSCSSWPSSCSRSRSTNRSHGAAKAQAVSQHGNSSPLKLAQNGSPRQRRPLKGRLRGLPRHLREQPLPVT
jgi:hypothetical protein